ncbi:uncharacterized protein LOC116340684 [Contarinia nasturtii]|uniref:uncharacterized protein LOC116340684 n=1 Tax=Contarinia nasturtii TaxID=265458 RepID=UPI0012D47E72|nr:uncharacterized protein LOC116340684 [Contarinia nasturtii]
MAECLQISQNNRNNSNDDDDYDDYEEYCENFTFSATSTCCVCNGYYAPSFGEPLCGTCHAFLFPVAAEEKRSTDLSDNDEDSGNDEPPYKDPVPHRIPEIVRVDQPGEEADDDFIYFPPFHVDRVLSPADDQNEHPNSPATAASTSRNNDRMAIYENAFLGNRPDPEAPRNLRQYLNALTEGPHERPINANQNAIRQVDDANNVAAPMVANKPNTIAALPVEVLLVIFSYLDDISLCHVGEVCKQWKKILEIHTPQQLWQRYTRTRWPLYHQITHTTNWFKIYSSLMKSCFCRTCVIQMTLRTPQQRENHFRSRRLRGDIRTLTADATEGIEAVPLDNSLSHWQASIVGPTGSPYEGGKFFLHILIPFSYPMHPPIVRFLTKIIHPNVSRHGDVGIDIIQHNWSLALTISKLLLSVQSLLTDPFTEICMEPELGRLYEQDRSRFEALARRFTWKYAMQEVIP